MKKSPTCIINQVHLFQYTLLLILFTLSGNIHAQSTGDGQNPTWNNLLLKNKCQTQDITGAYIHTFHACNDDTDDCTDPMNHTIYVAQSDDGVAWEIVPGYDPYQGSVPDPIRRDDTLYIYNIGKVRKFNFKKCKWSSPVTVTIQDSEGTPEDYADPSMIIDPEGRLVTFYLESEPGGDPARCQDGVPSCDKYIKSATEQDDSDGTVFIVDPGYRATINITSSEAASDPDIFAGDSGYVLYVSRGQEVQALSAVTLREPYVNIGGSLTDGILASAGSSTPPGGIPSGYYNSSTGRYWTYVHSNSSGKEVIRWAEHSVLTTPLLDADFTDIVSGTTFSGLGAAYSTASPGFAVNE